MGVRLAEMFFWPVDFFYLGQIRDLVWAGRWRRAEFRPEKNGGRPWV
jgi:hypothetical protein